MTALSALRSSVYLRTGLETDDAFFPAATVDAFINASLQQMSTFHRWPWLEKVDTTFTATVVGQSAYTPAADWRTTRRLQIDATDLELRTPRDMAQYANNNGRPYFYYIEAEEIYLVPTPSTVKAVTHVYTATEPALSDDSDEPLLPNEYADLLVVMASRIVSLRKRDLEMYTMLTSERNDWLAHMRDDVRRSAAPSRLKARNDWGMNV